MSSIGIWKQGADVRVSDSASTVSLVNVDQLFSALTPYLTAAIAETTYVPRAGGTMTGNLVVPSVTLGGIDGPRLDRSGSTIRARTNDGLSDAAFSAASVSADGISVFRQIHVAGATGLCFMAITPATGSSVPADRPWIMYTANGSLLRTRDMVNSRDQIQLTAGATSTAALTNFFSRVTVQDALTANGTIQSNASTGFAIGGVANLRRISYSNSPFTRFTFLSDTNSTDRVAVDALSVGGALASVQPPASGIQSFGPTLNYNSYTDDSNFERGHFRWASSVLQIGTERAGTGSARRVEIQTDGITRMSFGESNTNIDCSQDQDGRYRFGRAVLQSIITDNLYLAHFDHATTTNYALRQNSFGGTVLNSVSGQLLQLAIGNVTTVAMNDTQFIIGSNPAIHSSIFGFNSTTHTAPVNGGRGVSIYGRNNVNDAAHVGIGGEAFAFSTTSSNILMLVGNSFVPSSGTANYFAVRVAPSINQTGGSSGITRGIGVEPSITSAADWRSFDTNVNAGFAYHSSGTAPSRFGGNVGIGTIPSARFQVESNDNSTQGIVVRNLNDGTAASTDLTLSNLGGQSVSLRNHSSTHTVWPNTSVLSTSQTGGLAINSSTTGPVSLWVNNTERVRATTTGTFFVSPILIGGSNGDGINTTPISFNTPINVTTRFFGAGEGSRGFAFAHFQNGANINRLIMQQRTTTTYTDRFVFDFTLGNAGVGVLPVARLHVRGSGDTSATNTVRFENSAGAASLIVRDDGPAIFSSHITSAFQTLSTDPSTIDIPAGSNQIVKNTTSGEVRDWVNDGGVMKKSPVYT